MGRGGGRGWSGGKGRKLGDNNVDITQATHREGGREEGHGGRRKHTEGGES